MRYYIRMTLKKTGEVFTSRHFASKDEACDYYWEKLRGKISTLEILEIK